MKCRRCNRPLKNPIYVKLGIGKICLSKEKVESESYKDPDSILTPFSGDVEVKRDGNKKYINIEQRLIRHSPTGLEWGYGGSGPADFAANILFKFTGDEKFSWKHHQDFKWDFVSRLPREGGIIAGGTITEWIKDKRHKDSLEAFRDLPQNATLFMHASFKD